MEKSKQYTRPINKPVQNRDFVELNPLVAGWQNCRPGHFFGPVIRRFYLIHYVISGKGKFENERGVYNIGAGEYFIIRPNEKTRYESDPDDPWEYVWIGFNGSLASHFDDVPDTGNFSDAQIFHEIKGVNGFETSIEEFLVSKLFMIYYILLCKSKKSDLPSRISNFIVNNYAQELRVEEIAQDFNISRAYLNRIFNERYGMPVKSYILQVKMSNAKKLLSSGYSIAETSSLVGYSDQFAFSKSFKKYFGKPPLEYKKIQAQH